MYDDFYTTQQFNETFGTYNEGLGTCPLMSKQGKVCYCTKDCGVIGDRYRCPIKRLNKALDLLEEILENAL